MKVCVELHIFGVFEAKKIRMGNQWIKLRHFDNECGYVEKVLCNSNILHTSTFKH